MKHLKWIIAVMILSIPAIVVYLIGRSAIILECFFFYVERWAVDALDWLADFREKYAPWPWS